MTTEAGAQKAETARKCRSKGRYNEAAEYYTAAAYEYFGENGLKHAVSTARGLRYLLIGAACLRHESDHDRCRNRCWQGVLISRAVAQAAESLPRESHPHEQSERGIWYEFEGDFRAVGGVSDAGSAYEKAERVYRDAGDPESVSLEQFHAAVAGPTKLLVRGTDTDAERLDELLGPTATLTEWLAFKRQRLPTALERLERTDDWTYTF